MDGNWRRSRGSSSNESGLSRYGGRGGFPSRIQISGRDQTYDENWKCTRCNELNFSTYTSCCNKKCQAPRSGMCNEIRTFIGVITG